MLPPGLEGSWPGLLAYMLAYKIKVNAIERYGYSPVIRKTAPNVY